MPIEQYIRPLAPDAEQSYWTDDAVVGEGALWRSTYSIRLKAHVNAERYRERELLIPDIQSAGERVYVHAKPYVLVPDMTVTVGLYPSPAPDEAVGEVTESDWVGMRHVEIGQAQAWHYPADNTLVLWECYPEPSAGRGESPAEDELWKTLWKGFEWFLTERLPGISRIVTPAWDPGYDRHVWRSFLESLGYMERSSAAFEKVIPTP